MSKAALTNSLTPPQSTTCSPNRSVFGFFGERRFNHPTARATNAFGVGEAKLRRFFAGSFTDGDQARDAAACLELAAHQVSGTFGCHEQRVHAVGCFDLVEVDIEAVRAHQDVARRQLVANVVSVEVALHFVGQQDVDQVAASSRFVDRQRLKAVAHGQIVVRAAGTLANDDVCSRCPLSFVPERGLANRNPEWRSFLSLSSDKSASLS